MTAPEPSGAGAKFAMLAALKDAGAVPEDVDYINAHGTSTPHNDAMETAAMCIVTFLSEMARMKQVACESSGKTTRYTIIIFRICPEMVTVQLWPL